MADLARPARARRERPPGPRPQPAHIHTPMIALLASLPLWAAPTAPAAVLRDPTGAQDPAGAEGRPPAAAGDQEPAEVPPIQDLGDTLLLNFDESTEGLSLRAFVKICQGQTGINFYMSEENAGQLDTLRVRMFGPKRVKKEDFYSFFQIIMIINRFVCTRIGPDHLSVVVVQGIDTGARTNLRQDALYIQPDDIPKYADQPAVLIQTVVTMPHTDVRTLSNSLRAIVTDPNTLQVIPVGNSNSLILQGFGSTIAALVRMLELVDEHSKPEDPILPEFELIRLEFADAEEIADTIEELLEASVQAERGAAQRQQQQGATAPIPQGQSETKIMVDPRTNSLLVMAMPDDMPRIKELVARLDIDLVERERTYHFYVLENADAVAMQEVLDQFLQESTRVQPAGPGGQQRAQQGGGGGGGSSNEVVVVADPATNSLLIAAGRSKYEEVIDLVQRMDRRQDQVLIETALIELTGRDILTLGIELGGAELPGTGETGGFGVTDFGMSTFADNDLDGIPDTRIPTQAIGFTAGILDGDDFNLPLLLQMTQEQRNTNVLNIPSVLVNNNGSAVVRTLDEQPTTQITGVGTAGVAPTESFQGYQEAGITLQISPSISASRYLRLDISLVVSSFLGSVSGPIPPPRITREITTTVNVPDGDTMVIGGIIVDNKTDTSNRVPWLADIPVLGWLFKKDARTKERTSLYFFVTPHILHDEEFADLSAISYRKKLEAADTIGSDRIRMIDPTFGQGQGEIDLSGFDVPLYRAPARGEVEEEAIGKDTADVNEMLKRGKDGKE